MAGKRVTIWTRDFILLFFINNILFMGFQMITPIIPKYTSDIGAGGAMLGLVTAVFAGASFLVRPIAGPACDRFNKNLILSLSLCGLFLSIFAYNLSQNILVLLLFRFLHGICFGINQTAVSTIVALILPEEKMSSGIGVFSLGMVVSMGAGPAVGIWLMEDYGYAMLFSSAGFFTAAAFLLTFFVSRQPILPPVDKPASHEGSGGPGFLALEATVPSLVTFLNSFAFGVVSTFLILHGEDRGIGNVGAFFTVYAAALLVVRAVAGRVAARVSVNRILYPCSVFLCVSLLLLWGATSLGHLVAAAVIQGVCNGFAQPILQSMALLSVEPERRGVASGTYFMGVDLGNSAAPVAAGMVAAYYGYGAAFLFMVIPVSLGILVLYAGARRAKKSAAT